jgi:hypothetical protein
MARSSIQFRAAKISQKFWRQKALAQAAKGQTAKSLASPRRLAAQIIK